MENAWGAMSAAAKTYYGLWKAKRVGVKLLITKYHMKTEKNSAIY